MCFSLEVSILSFIISWSVGIYLLRKKLTNIQRNNIIFLLIFSCMQIGDSILWYNEMKKNNINYYTTSILIPLILSLQLLFNSYIRNEGKNKILNIVSIIGSLYLFVRFNGYSKSSCSNKLSSPIWGSNEIKYWEMILFAIFIFYPNYNQLFVFLFLVIPSIMIYFNGGYGSLWCATACGISLYYLYKY